MPKSAKHTIQWSQEWGKYLLSDSKKNEDSSLLENSEEWLKWLEEHHAFAFGGRNGHLNMLKERRRGEGYWYAYQRRGGEVLKRYVGRNEQMRMERLEEIASLLGNKDDIGRVDDVAVAEDKSTASSMQFEPLLMSKLQLPRLQKSLLLREPLLELLDKGLEYKLTIIAGPAGYGKTTLVSQWVAECNMHTDCPHIVSVTLDENDNDPIRFWRYIIAACQGFQEGLGKEALDLLLAHRLPPFKPLTMMLTALLNELSTLEHASVLILDDFHVISSSQVIETLNFFLEHLPTSFHMIMLIRGDPPFSLARLRARNELLDIYPPQLAFSWEETRAFFGRELSFPLSLKLLRQIYERMDGWPTGLRLLARDLQQSNSAEDIERTLAAFAGNHWSIQDYFLSEVLYTLSTDQQEFLLQTSSLPLIAAPLCDVVTGRVDSRQRIEALRGSDLFLIPLDSIGEWSRYHALFAEAMQQEAHRRLGGEQLRLLAARASNWYEEHGYLAEAIETGLNGADFTRATKLITQFIEGKQEGITPTIPEWYSIKHWVERLPEEDLERHADLCMYYAMALLFALMEGLHFPQGKERVEYLLQVAEEKWRGANNTEKLAEVFAFRALLARREGRILQAVTWAKQALAWLPQEDRMWRNLGLTVVGIGEMLDGHLTRAYELLLEALTLSELQGNHIYARATRNMLSGVSLERGELRHSAEQVRLVQAEARAQEDRGDVAHTQLALAQIAYQWNNLNDAEQAALEALEIGKQMNEEEFQAHATVHLARIEHAHGQSTQARRRLMAWLAQVPTPTSPYSYQLAHEVQSTLAQVELANGNLAAVEHWFVSSEQSEEILPLLQGQRKQLLYTRLLMAQGEAATAIEKLAGLQAAALRTGHVLLRLEVQVVLAQAYARHGLLVKAREQLHEVLARTQGEGYMRLFLDEGKVMADLLRRLLPHLQEKVLLVYARQVLNAFAQEIGTPTLEATPGGALLLEPLSQQEQRVLRLLAAGNANAEIARELVVSVNTVRTQIQSIYRKLNVNNRVEASSIAKQLELI